MRVKAQVAMVMNLDKCIGCHTCSVTCKQVWTNRPGTEYVWFNNVETEPGPGLPAPVGRPGALERRLGARPQGPAAAEGRRPGQEAADDLLQPRPAGDRRLLRAVHLRLRDARRRAARRPRPGRAPALAAHRQADGRRSGGRTGTRGWPAARSRAPKDPHLQGMQEQVRMTYEQAFMFFLPRICEHCLNPSCVASLPVGRDVQARGGRHRARRPGPLPRLALLRLGLPVQEGLLQPPHRQGREVHALLPADRDRPADDLLGDLRRAHPLPRPRALRRRPRRRRPRRCPTSATCSPPSATCSSTPRTRRCARRPRARRHPARLDRRGAALAGLRPGDALGRGAAAAPRVPHAADGLVRAAALAGRLDARDRRLRGRPRRRLRRDRQPADPARVPRQPAHRRRRRRRPRRAAPARRDARLHAQARGARRDRRRSCPAASG